MCWERRPSGGRRRRETAPSERRHSVHAHLGTCRSEADRKGDGRDLVTMECDTPRRPELADVHEPQRGKGLWHPPLGQTSEQAVARGGI